MTEPSQYFKGRTVQEQMNEVIGYVDTRAAEVATDAIASDVAQVHQDMLDADADATAAAASAAAAAGTLANAVKKTGEASQSIAGDIAVSGDLSAGGDLAITGDAGVQGQLSVLGGCDLRAPVKVPTVATGTFDDNAANGTKVKNELDNYAPMVRTTGNQIIAGAKTFMVAPGVEINGVNYGYTINNTTMKQSGPYVNSISYIRFLANGQSIGNIELVENTSGARTLRIALYDKNGNFHYKTLFAINEDGNEI